MSSRAHYSTATSGVSSPSMLPRFMACMLLAGSCALPIDASAQGKDDLWEVTVKMEIPGMPMAMPAQTHRTCVAKTGTDDALVPKQDNCKVVESKRTGSKLTYRMVCAGKDPMEAAGEITYGNGTYDGRTVMKGRMEGQAVEMTQTFSGKRVADCTAVAK